MLTQDLRDARELNSVSTSSGLLERVQADYDLIGEHLEGAPDECHLGFVVDTYAYDIPPRFDNIPLWWHPLEISLVNGICHRLFNHKAQVPL